MSVCVYVFSLGVYGFVDLMMCAVKHSYANDEIVVTSAFFNGQ